MCVCPFFCWQHFPRTPVNCRQTPPKFKKNIQATLISTATSLKINYRPRLVGGLEHVLFFHHILGMILPSDELIFFRGVETHHQRRSFPCVVAIISQGRISDFPTMNQQQWETRSNHQASIRFFLVISWFIKPNKYSYML